jgi:hypothetical protein
MKNTSLLLYAILLALTSCFPFCKKDPVNCKDETVGDVYFSAQAKAFFPEINGAQMVFENAQGLTRSYTVMRTTLRIPLHIEKLCESFDLSTHYRNMNGDAVLYKLRALTDSMEIQMNQVSGGLGGKKDTIFYDHLSVIYLAEMSGAEWTKIIATRGNDTKIPSSDIAAQSAQSIGDVTLAGKSFTKVWSGRLISGSPMTAKHQIYVAEGRGLVGFTDPMGVEWAIKN